MRARGHSKFEAVQESLKALQSQRAAIIEEHARALTNIDARISQTEGIIEMLAPSKRPTRAPAAV